MNNQKNKTKDQLIKEIEALQNRVEELEQSETLREKAEETLHHEKNKLLGIIESIEDGVYIVNQNHDIEYVNPVLEKDFGPWEGVKCYKYFHDREKVCPWCKNKEVWAGKTVRWEWYSNKNQKTYDLIDTPIKNSDGSISKFEIFRDITERKQVEEKLKQASKLEKKRLEELRISYDQIQKGQEASLNMMEDLSREIKERKLTEETLLESKGRFRQFFENEPAYCYMISPEGNILNVNNAALKILGYKKEELINKPLKTIYAEEFLPKAKQLFEKWEKTGKVKNEEFEIVTKKGEKRIVILNAEAVKDRNGKILHSISVQQDITERKQAEAALKDSEEKFKILFESAPDAYYLSNLEGTFIDGNKAAEKLFGSKKNELIANNFLKMNILEKDEISRMVKLLVLNSRGISTGPDEFILKRKDNRKVFTEILTHPMKIKDKNLVLSIARDITKRKKVEDMLKKSEKKLRDLTRHLQIVREQERTNIARDLHDELGQLITALKMDIVWMKNKLPEKQEDLVEKLQSMSNLIDVTINTVKRMSSELRPGILDDLGLLAAMEWYIGEFQERTGIKCSLDLKHEKILIDPERTTALYRILQETLTNVTRHARASSIAVNFIKEKNILKLRISDNGIGITQEEISSAQSFGLIGIQERAEVFGGNVKITGKKGKGTTVVVTIPLG